MGGGWIFFFGGGEGHRGTQKGCTGYSTHTGVHMCTHGGTQMYKGVRGVHGGTHGCTGEHRGTQAYTWVHKGYTRVHKGYTRGTVRRAGVLYTGVQYCTQGYYTQGYTGVHGGTQGYTGVYIHRGAAKRTGRNPCLIDCTESKRKSQQQQRSVRWAEASKA